MRRTSSRSAPAAQRAPAKVSLARALSKLGYCSRTQARALISAGAVAVEGSVCIDPERRVDPARARIEVSGRPLHAITSRYLMLNKPRGLVTTRADERDRDTVYGCFEGAALPHLSPVGRLDKASEGLLLFSNDTRWAQGITAPVSGPDKVYHVQIDAMPDASLLAAIHAGVITPDGEHLAVKQASALRQGARNGWLEITLDEGRNRHIRRLLETLGVAVLRLIRVRIGELALGALAKGQWRDLTPAEVQALRPVRATTPSQDSSVPPGRRRASPRP